MTSHKHLKQLVRSRMQKTGESYSTARRHIIRQAGFIPAAATQTGPAQPGQSSDQSTTLRQRSDCHFPGNVPATTALRVLLAHAEIYDPRSASPFSEALLFCIAGGIGAGVFSFLYEKEDFASFFVAGRHLWHDDVAYLDQACESFGVKPTIGESSGEKVAAKQLRETLAEYGVCIAWVDMSLLRHRAMPAYYQGGGYHVVTVYEIDEANGTALIGDLADDPISIPLGELASARARIKKQKNRLLTISPAVRDLDLPALLRRGLRACHAGLTTGRMKNFQLDAFRMWGERMHGSKEKESWDRVFIRGKRLWHGLTSMYDFIEHYGTGGGLCRPIFAEGLAEAADAIGDERLRALAQRYEELGAKWTSLANAALPGDVALFRDARQLLAEKSELTLTGGQVERVQDCWNRANDLARRAENEFPLTEAECGELRAGLQERILALHAGEVAAAKAMAEFTA